MLTKLWSQPARVAALSGALGASRGGWSSTQSASPSVAVMPGEAATPDVLRREEAREALIALVHRFAAYGLTWNPSEAGKITPMTELTAVVFLRALPAGKAFPKISPDGEGGLMLVWERVDGPVLLTIDNLRLHAVIAAATPAAEYIDDLPFDLPQDIPQQILDAIPAR